MREGWKLGKLGDFSAINYGYTAKATFENVGPKFLRITDIQNGNVDWREVPNCQISQKEFERHVLHDKDIVFARTGATTGKSFLLHDPPQAVAASYLIRLRVENPKALPEFVALYFQSKDYWDTVFKGLAGSAQGGFNASKLKNLRLPIPTLPEQKRIVAILDEAFAGIERAVANTEKNLAKARELFETYLNSLFLSKNGWEKLHLEEVLSVQPRNGWSPPAKNHSSKGTPVLTLSSVTGFHFNPRKIKFTSADVDHSRHYWVKNGDLLITRSNTPELVGHVAVASNIGIPTIYPDLIMRMVPDSEKVLTKFLYFQLRTSVLREEIKGRAQGANPTMKKIGKKAVQTLPIVLPPIPQQEMILSKIERIVEETLHLEEVYQRKLIALSELKQSLLQKAFSGELTADPDRASKEVAA